MRNRREYPHGHLVKYSRDKCRCDLCRGANAEMQRKWRAANLEHSKRYDKQYYVAHYKADPDPYRAYQRRRRLALRKEVLGHYGGVCACCGEHRLPFLSLDHKDGGGSKHRKELGLRGANMWAWVKRAGFPPLFQVLCHNCNQAKGYYGICPHEQERTPTLRVVGGTDA